MLACESEAGTLRALHVHATGHILTFGIWSLSIEKWSINTVKMFLKWHGTLPLRKKENIWILLIGRRQFLLKLSNNIKSYLQETPPTASNNTSSTKIESTLCNFFAPALSTDTRLVAPTLSPFGCGGYSKWNSSSCRFFLCKPYANKDLLRFSRLQKCTYRSLKCNQYDGKPLRVI